MLHHAIHAGTVGAGKHPPLLPSQLDRAFVVVLPVRTLKRAIPVGFGVCLQLKFWSYINPRLCGIPRSPDGQRCRTPIKEKHRNNCRQ